MDDMEWQQDRELGQAGAACEFDQTVVTTHQVLRDGHPVEVWERFGGW